MPNNTSNSKQNFFNYDHDSTYRDDYRGEWILICNKWKNHLFIANEASSRLAILFRTHWC